MLFHTIISVINCLTNGRSIENPIQRLDERLPENETTASFKNFNIVLSITKGSVVLQKYDFDTHTWSNIGTISLLENTNAFSKDFEAIQPFYNDQVQKENTVNEIEASLSKEDVNQKDIPSEISFTEQENNLNKQASVDSKNEEASKSSDINKQQDSKEKVGDGEASKSSDINKQEDSKEKVKDEEAEADADAEEKDDEKTEDDEDEEDEESEEDDEDDDDENDNTLKYIIYSIIGILLLSAIVFFISRSTSN